MQRLTTWASRASPGRTAEGGACVTFERGTRMGDEGRPGAGGRPTLTFRPSY